MPKEAEHGGIAAREPGTRHQSRIESQHPYRPQPRIAARFQPSGKFVRTVDIAKFGCRVSPQPGISAWLEIGRNLARILVSRLRQRSFLGWIVRATRNENDLPPFCHFRQQEIGQQEVAKMVDAKRLLISVTGFSRRTDVLKPALQTIPESGSPAFLKRSANARTDAKEDRSRGINWALHPARSSLRCASKPLASSRQPMTTRRLVSAPIHRAQ